MDTCTSAMLTPPGEFFPDNLDPAEYLASVFSLQSAMTEEEEYLTSLLAITEALKYGTTCFLDPGSTKFLDSCLQAYQESGCRIVVGAQVTDLPNPLNLPVYTLPEAANLMEETVRTYDGRLQGRVRAWTMPFAADYCTKELLAAAKDIADRNGTGMTLHQANSPGQHRCSSEAVRANVRWSTWSKSACWAATCCWPT